MRVANVAENTLAVEVRLLVLAALCDHLISVRIL